MKSISKVRQSQAYDVDTITSFDKDMNQAVLLACKLNNISPQQLHPFIPSKAGLRNTFVFKCLLNIYVYPRQTKTFYAKHFHLCQTAAAKAMEYLCSLGLIKPLGRPRLIIPFQTYKVDTAYQLTVNGKMVIKKVMDSI
jgi:hypothetical protein